MMYGNSLLPLAWAQLWQVTVVVFAGPAQFAMIDAASNGVWFQVMSVGVLVNLRFLLMSITLSTLFGHVSRTRLAIWSYFVSASSYLVTFFESRHNNRVDAFLTGVVAAVGVGVGVVPSADLAVAIDPHDGGKLIVGTDWQIGKRLATIYRI